MVKGRGDRHVRVGTDCFYFFTLLFGQIMLSLVSLLFGDFGKFIYFLLQMGKGRKDKFSFAKTTLILICKLVVEKSICVNQNYIIFCF